MLFEALISSVLVGGVTAFSTLYRAQRQELTLTEEEADQFMVLIRRNGINRYTIAWHRHDMTTMKEMMTKTVGTLSAMIHQAERDDATPYTRAVVDIVAGWLFRTHLTAIPATCNGECGDLHMALTNYIAGYCCFSHQQFDLLIPIAQMATATGSETRLLPINEPASRILVGVMIKQHQLLVNPVLLFDYDWTSFRGEIRRAYTYCSSTLQHEERQVLRLSTSLRQLFLRQNAELRELESRIRASLDTYVPTANLIDLDMTETGCNSDRSTERAFQTVITDLSEATEIASNLISSTTQSSLDWA